MLKEKRRHTNEATPAPTGDATVDATVMHGACPLAVLSLDLEGKVRVWNRGAEQIFGWRAEEVLGGELPTAPRSEREEYQRLLESQFHGAAHAGVEVRRQHKNGAIVDASLWTIPLRDALGVIKGNVAILTDITGTDPAERQYREL